MTVITIGDRLSLEKKENHIRAVDIDTREIRKEVINEFAENRTGTINDVKIGKLTKEFLRDEVKQYIVESKFSVELNEREAIIKNVLDYFFGYYLVQDLLLDPDITDVYFNSEYVIRAVHKRRGIFTTDIKFSGRQEYTNFIHKIARANEVNLNGKASRVVVTDYSTIPGFALRISMTDESLNPKGVPIANIRKVPQEAKYSTTDLISEGMYSEEIKEYLEMGAKAGFFFIICGEGGSGKTQLMNAYLEEIPNSIETLVVQESDELFSNKDNIKFLHTKIKQAENDDEVTLRDLTIDALRMSVKQIIIGEVKREESYELFNSVYTGHRGWVSMHTFNSKEALNRLVQIMKYQTDHSEESLLKMLATTHPVIIFLKNFKIRELTEVEGFDYSKNEVIYRPIFKYKDKEFIRMNEPCAFIKERVKEWREEYEDNNS